MQYRKPLRQSILYFQAASLQTQLLLLHLLSARAGLAAGPLPLMHLPLGLPLLALESMPAAQQQMRLGYNAVPHSPLRPQMQQRSGTL